VYFSTFAWFYPKINFDKIRIKKFCCPECDFKSKAVPLFMNHAAKNHPDAKGLVHVLLSKFYSDFIQI
jgi:hypothetical protein